MLNFLSFLIIPGSHSSFVHKENEMHSVVRWINMLDNCDFIFWCHPPIKSDVVVGQIPRWSFPGYVEMSFKMLRPSRRRVVQRFWNQEELKDRNKWLKKICLQYSHLVTLVTLRNSYMITERWLYLVWPLPMLINCWIRRRLIDWWIWVITLREHN